jgi:23S rRNA pseudouridine1911/1915/1917 synthase
MTEGIRKEYAVDEESAGMRLDRFLHERLPGISRHEIIHWIESGKVTCTAVRTKKGMSLKVGDRILVTLPYPIDTSLVIADPDVSLQILFEDPYLVAIHKPPGMPTHPLQSGERGTVANVLVHRYPEMHAVGFSPREPGLIHRLDRDTTGVLLAARQQPAFEALRLQFDQGKILKIYTALVHGHPDNEGEIDLPIGAGGRRSDRVKVVAKPRKGIRSLCQARTRYRCIQYLERSSLVRIWTSTGARHQIRAHMAFLGHPVLGDRLYGSVAEAGWKGIRPPRHMLHATAVRFDHPSSGEPKEIRCPLHRDFQMVLAGIASDA